MSSNVSDFGILATLSFKTATRPQLGEAEKVPSHWRFYHHSTSDVAHVICVPDSLGCLVYTETIGTVAWE